MPAVGRESLSLWCFFYVILTYRICRNKHPLRNKRPPVIFEGGVHKIDGLWWGLEVFHCLKRLSVRGVYFGKYGSSVWRENRSPSVLIFKFSQRLIEESSHPELDEKLHNWLRLSWVHCGCEVEVPLIYFGPDWLIDDFSPDVSSNTAHLFSF